MISTILALLKDNKGVSVLISALTAIVLLGGTGTITLPGEVKAEENSQAIMNLKIDLESKLAQNWEEQHSVHESQRRALYMEELSRIQWDMDSINEQIERYDDLPSYLGRNLNGNEEWKLESLKKTWIILKERERELLEQLGE